MSYLIVSFVLAGCQMPDYARVEVSGIDRDAVLCSFRHIFNDF